MQRDEQDRNAGEEAEESAPADLDGCGDGGGSGRREGTEKGYWESGTGPSQDEQEEITES
jgi:hypothetical protein